MEDLVIDSVADADAFGRLERLLPLVPSHARAEADAALAEARGAARRAELELQELVHAASHDLTEPLRTVTSYLQLLERRLGPIADERSRELLFYAEDGTARMKALIDDLLRYSRAATGGLERRTVYLDTLVVEVLRDLGPAIADAGAQVEVAAPLPAIAGDRQQIGQLLQNLIANAVKFRRPERGSTVRVAAGRTADDAGWEITVADDGIGVDADRADRIWRVFERLHGPEGYAGNGIGLAICRRIAERHGGVIWVTPAPGGGSVFHVVLRDELDGGAAADEVLAA